MPTYEYICSDCKTNFELRRSIKQIDDPAACPKCRGNRVARQISKVMAFSHGDGGGVSALGGGGGCGSCSSTSCGSCASRN
ncbi:MAG: zinc ribbon domain-containing protein [Anaerolineales bacterium]|nr:zinc ribbon domain-containing protein [Anaerolineales bacterium]